MKRKTRATQQALATQQEVADKLGYTRQTIARWRDNGKLGATFGLYPVDPARTRYSRRELARAVAEHCPDPQPPVAAPAA